jgi:hypothetical protein
MKLSHKVALLATTVGFATATLAPAFASAQIVSTNQNSQFSSFIQALATRLNISVSDLETFFQQNLPKPPARESGEARPSDGRAELGNGPSGSVNASANLETRLTSDVAAGKMSEAQKTAILAKSKEAQAKHEEARKLSPEECRKMMEAYRVELEVWVTTRGLDRSYLPAIMGHHPKGPQNGSGSNQIQGQAQGQIQGEAGMQGEFGRRPRGPRGGRPNGMGLGLMGQGSAGGFIGSGMNQ